MSRWRPLLTGEPAQRAIDIARQIADAVDSASPPDIFRPLLDAYLAKVLASDVHAERALSALTASFEAARGLPPALFSGLAGLGWVTEHVTRLLTDWIEPADDDACQPIDEAILVAVKQHAPHDNYDLISGLTGFAIYALEREPRGRGMEILSAVIERLTEDAALLDGGISWHTPAARLPAHQREKAPNGYYNLGVAHGTPGLTVVLGQAQKRGIGSRTAELLAGLVGWILSQQRPNGSGARFPPFVTGPSLEGESRESWCYGGLGLSVALFKAARLVGNTAWQDCVVELARLEARRTPEQRRHVDMCLCHGGAGNAHLYNRLYQATGEELFRTTALERLTTTFQARRLDSRGFGGFLFRVPKDRFGPASDVADLPEPTFLSGSVGVGLALLAAGSAEEPGWDRLLLTDVPPACAG